MTETDLLPGQASIPTSVGYPALPNPSRRDGKPRRVGVELEFAGLTAREAAGVVAAWSGGDISLKSAHHAVVNSPDLGAFEVYLDMAASHPKGAEPSEIEASVRRTLGDTAQAVVPVEIVCPPLAVERLPELDGLIDALARAGAVGTEGSLLYAHGMHLNVEAVSLSAADVAPILKAFVLCEDWLRDELALDLTRRALSFVDPFPARFIDAVADAAFGRDTDALIDSYLAENPTRNRSLDMTPLLACIDHDRVERALSGAKLKPRPTFHYRLPDCRIGEPGWSLARDWRAWVVLERIAGDPALLSALSNAWTDHRSTWLSMRSTWVAKTREILGDQGIQ